MNLRHLLYISCFTISLFVVQSCLVTKEYETPEVSLEPFSRLDTIYTDTASLAAIEWRTYYGDPVLQGYIDSALVHNYDMRKAEKRIEAANSYFLEGRAAFLPTLDGGANVNYQNISKNSRFGEFGPTSITQYELSLSASWEADIWGKIRSQRNASEVQYLSSQTARRAIQTELVASIADTYYRLLAADTRKELIERTIFLRDTSMRVMQDLKDAGETTALAVNQAAAQVEETRVLLSRVNNEIYMLENTMMTLLGYPLDSIPRRSFDEQPEDPEIMVGVPASLLAYRPDVQLAELDLRYAFELHNVAIASLYPSITISAGVGLQALDPADLLDINSFFANILGGITQPIFKRRQLKTNEEVTLAQMEEQVIAFEEIVFEAGMEVSDALYHYKTENEVLGHRNQQEAHLKFALENSVELLKAGFADYLEVLIVQESILNVQLFQIDAELGKYRALSELYRALGGGA